MQITGGLNITGGMNYFKPQSGVVSSNLVLEFTNSTSANLPLAGTVNVTVNWGDGSVETFNTPGVKTHTYSSTGNYTVNVSGSLTGFGSSSASNPSLRRVVDFGNLGITSLANAFYNAPNLVAVPSSLPTTVTDLSGAFFGTSLFNDSNIVYWDTSKVTNLANTFRGTGNFNVSIGDWNVSNVTNMHATLYGTQSFNQPIEFWNTGNVTDMSYMFYFSKVFNQFLNNWNTGKVSNMSNMFAYSNAFSASGINTWNVSNVVDMSNMFDTAFANFSVGPNLNSWNTGNVSNMRLMFANSGFNGNITGWNVSKVTNMGGMFANAAYFNQNIGGWNVSNVTDIGSMFQLTSSFNGNIGDWGTKTSKFTNLEWTFFYANVFNQDLSTWCVANIPSKPNNFDLYANAWTGGNATRPQWGAPC